MKVKPRFPAILGVLLILLLLAGGAATRARAEKRPAGTAAGPEGVSPLLVTALPVKRRFTRTVPWIGRVESRAAVVLSAQLDGRVVALDVADQALVAAGQTIAKLGGPRVETERARLTGQIGSLTTLLDLNRQTLARLKVGLRAQLATRDQMAVAQATRAKLANQLRQARLDLESFEMQGRMVAPISGTFTQRKVSVGQEVTAGQAIGTIVDGSRLRIVAELFPPRGVTLQSKPVSIRLDQQEILTAQVRSVLPAAGETGATVVWIEGPQVDERLRPGQAVAGDLVLEVTPEMLAVPEAAIVYDEEEHPLLFIRSNGAYAPRRVELGLSQDGWVEVLSGLEANQPVVVEGAYEVFYRQFNQQFKVPD
jgi:RND family efflux transporter MFP subunit